MVTYAHLMERVPRSQHLVRLARRLCAQAFFADEPKALEYLVSGVLERLEEGIDDRVQEGYEAGFEVCNEQLLRYLNEQLDDESTKSANDAAVELVSEVERLRGRIDVAEGALKELFGSDNVDLEDDIRLLCEAKADLTLQLDEAVKFQRAAEAAREVSEGQLTEARDHFDAEYSRFGAEHFEISQELKEERASRQLAEEQLIECRELKQQYLNRIADLDFERGNFGLEFLQTKEELKREREARQFAEEQLERAQEDAYDPWSPDPETDMKPTQKREK